MICIQKLLKSIYVPIFIYFKRASNYNMLKIIMCIFNVYIHKNVILVEPIDFVQHKFNMESYSATSFV